MPYFMIYSILAFYLTVLVLFMFVSIFNLLELLLGVVSYLFFGLLLLVFTAFLTVDFEAIYFWNICRLEWFGLKVGKILI